MSDVFVATDHTGTIIGIVKAENIRLAASYWQGAGIIPHDINAVPPLDASHPTGVIPVLKTKDASEVLRQAGAGKWRIVCQ